MNTFPFLTLFLGIFASSLYGQAPSASISLFFKSAQHDLSETEKAKLDSFILSIKGRSVKSIHIEGNTDSDSDSLFNIRLSQKRVLAVGEYFEKKGFDSALFSAAFYGESKPVAINDAESGKQKNRRVDITITFKPADTGLIQSVQERSVEPIEAIEKQPVTKDTCLSDTTIILPQGSRYTIKLCDYRKYKDCIQVTEYLTVESILNSNLTTLTANGDQLISAGMLDIKICDSAKLIQPLKFWVPVISFAEMTCDGKMRNREMLYWEADKFGRWTRSKKAKKVVVNDSSYYEFLTSRSHRCNLDAMAPLAPTIKTKFKAKGNVQLISVRVFYRQSIFEVKPGRKNTATLELGGCPTGLCNCIMVKITGIDSRGNTLVSQQCINDYKKRLLFPRCRQRVSSSKPTRLWGILPVKTRAVYRKYIIHPDEWTNLNSPEKN